MKSSIDFVWTEVVDVPWRLRRRDRITDEASMSLMVWEEGGRHERQDAWLEGCGMVVRFQENPFVRTLGVPQEDKHAAELLTRNPMRRVVHDFPLF